MHHHYGQTVEAKPSRGSDPRDVRWPADRFLWAIVDGPGKAGPLGPGLWPQFAEQVHADAESLAAVAIPLDGGRLLVCAVEKQALVELPADVLSLTPESVPECVPGSPDRLDLLVGEHLPVPCKSRAGLRHLLAAGGVCGAALLIALGLSRRGSGLERVARDADHRAGLIAASIDPSATLAELPFMAEEARQQADSIGALAVAGPVAPVLAELLSAWPVSSPPATLSVEPGMILITVVVEDDPGEFLAALRPPAGYRVQEPRLAAIAEGTQVTIVMERATQAAGGLP